MTPTETHEALDEMGALNHAHGPGVYALSVSVPEAVDAVQRTWLDAHDNPLPDAYAEQLAAATKCVYIGRSGDVYDRLMDHARGDVRRASFVSAFGVRAVRAVWPGENSVVAERGRARDLADATTCAWTDGELV
jgi:hypothetical protein